MNEEKINNKENEQDSSRNGEDNNTVHLDEIESLKNKVSELEGINNNLKDQLLRKAAEFENYKRRIENDFNSLTKYSNQAIVEKLLPILDDFERFLQHKPENSFEDPFHKGAELIYTKMIKILEQLGLKKMETVGKPFDVNFHDALLVVPGNDPNITDHTILEEVERGYTLHDKVIRHAKVVVSGTLENNDIAEGGGN